MANADGSLKQELSYTAWGLLRNAATQTAYTPGTEPALFLGRGYTGHEHLAWFGLINMNARMYDPALGRFLSPDPYVQMPDFTQNFNRYSYCLNNPLAYADEGGEFFFSLLLPGVGTFIDAALWGAVLGGVGYTASVAFSDGGFHNWNWGQFGKSVGLGAISGILTAGIGSTFGAVGSKGVMGEIARAYTHGFANGMISEFSGGDFMQGFASGGLGSLGGSAFQAWGGSFANSLAGTVSFSALSGGVGSELTGGNFWQGAATGAVVGLLNHEHATFEKKKGNVILKKLSKMAEAAGFAFDANDAYHGDKYAQLKVSVSLAGKAGLISKFLATKFNIAFMMVDTYLLYVDNIQPLVDKSLKNEGATSQQRYYYERQQNLRNYNKTINNTKIYVSDGNGGYKAVKY